jgi:hypothetical protein
MSFVRGPRKLSQTRSALTGRWHPRPTPGSEMKRKVSILPPKPKKSLDDYLLPALDTYYREEE